MLPLRREFCLVDTAFAVELLLGLFELLGVASEAVNFF